MTRCVFGEILHIFNCCISFAVGLIFFVVLCLCVFFSVFFYAFNFQFWVSLQRFCAFFISSLVIFACSCRCFSCLLAFFLYHYCLFGIFSVISTSSLHLCGQFIFCSHSTDFKWRSINFKHQTSSDLLLPAPTVCLLIHPYLYVFVCLYVAVEMKADQPSFGSQEWRTYCYC